MIGTKPTALNPGKYRILLVDDQEEYRQTLARLLLQRGYEVVQAEDGNTAKYQIQMSLFSLMITDQDMPNLTGIDLIRQLDATIGYRLFPIILASGNFTDLVTEKIERLKFPIKTIDKPFEIKSLLSLIEWQLTSWAP